jgi:hypothetical protein
MIAVKQSESNAMLTYPSAVAQAETHRCSYNSSPNFATTAMLCCC